MIKQLDFVTLELSKAYLGFSDSRTSQEGSAEIQDDRSLGLEALDSPTDYNGNKIATIDRWIREYQLLENDVLVIVIIVASMHLNLIPAFNLSPQSIFQRESNPNTTSHTSLNREGAYPSLVFLNSNKSASITISIVPVFGEMVIYAAKKELEIANSEIVKTSVNKGGIVVKDDKQKKKILTLYLTVSQFITKYNQNKLDESSAPKYCNSSITIGTYNVNLEEIIKRISGVLLLPLIEEKYVILNATILLVALILLFCMTDFIIFVIIDFVCLLLLLFLFLLLL